MRGACRGSCTGGAAPPETPAFYMIMSACGRARSLLKMPRGACQQHARCVMATSQKVDDRVHAASGVGEWSRSGEGWRPILLLLPC